MIRLHTFSVLDLRDSEGRELGSFSLVPSGSLSWCTWPSRSPGSSAVASPSFPLFWPDLEPSRARPALSQALHVLRSGLGDGVILSQGEEEVGLSPDHFWCDATAFDALLQEGKREEALDLYSGDFLPGFHVRGAPEFMDWLERQRLRYRKAASDAAEGLAKDQEASGKTAAAVSWIRRARDLSPFDEPLLQELSASAGPGRQTHGGAGRVRRLPRPARERARAGAISGNRGTGGRRCGKERDGPGPAPTRRGPGPSSIRLPSRPYKFLNPFEEEDAPIFFGRQKETRILLTKIHSFNLNLLFGPSGSGKTSLLKAGLVPQLRTEGNDPRLRPVGHDPGHRDPTPGFG